MPHICCVRDCTNRACRETDRSFHRIPRVITHQGPQTENLSRKRRARWIANIGLPGRDDTNTNWDSFRVCSDHFEQKKPASLYQQTNPDWAPTIKMGCDELHEGRKLHTRRRGRGRKRRARKEQFVKASACLDLKQARVLQTVDAAADVDDPPLEAPATALDKVTQPQEFSLKSEETEKAANEEPKADSQQKQLEVLQAECLHLREEKCELQSMVDSLIISPKYFSDNDDKVLFYTGLPHFKVLNTLFQFLASHVTRCKTVLTEFQQFVLTLMRLRLNLQIKDLAYRFGVSESTATSTFSDWIDIMYACMSGFVFWPEREHLMQTMPFSFRQHFHRKVAVIIECFEVLIDKPSNLTVRAETWSSYKQRNTVKFLAGTCPQGVISFMSKSVGGRVSDRHLIEHCGLLGKLLPGDVVLCDRGFDSCESVGLHCAELNIPEFAKVEKRLSVYDAEKTRKIATVQLHVERLIGQVQKKYTVLHDTLPVNFIMCRPGDDVAPIDKIAVVCSALTNLSESAVQFD